MPAILLETADLQDPIAVSNEVTYVIKVTNQGTSAGTHVRVVCTLPASEEFISATGTTPVQAQEPKGVAAWQVVVKALSADDARFKVEVSSDQFEQPSTRTKPPSFIENRRRAISVIANSRARPQKIAACPWFPNNSRRRARRST